jgi:hypothetical protein
LTASWTVKGDERRAIREGNIRLMEWAIEYPFLEANAYCESWPATGRADEDNMRYENFCCHVFNQLQSAWEFCKGDTQKMHHVLYPDELIWRHRKWWQQDEVNSAAYPVEFRRFVADRLRDMEMEKNHGSVRPPH